MTQRFSWPSQLALLLLALGACDEESPVPAPPATADAGSAAATTAEVRDAATTPRAQPGAPDTGPAPATVDASSPPRVDAGGAAAASDAGPTRSACGECASHEACDTPTGKCVDEYQPWRLDCAHLPAGTTCQGGPREVLLVAASGGAVAMFDPADGHFLGYFSRQDLGRDHEFIQAVQGPDQCVYLLDATSSALSRFSAEGVARGELELPGSTEPHSISFSNDRLYFASDDQIRRLTLEGKPDGELPVPGRQVVVGSDGSFVVRQRDALVHLPSQSGSQEPRTILAGLGSRGQVSYAGAGHALLADYGNAKLNDVELQTGVTKSEDTRAYWPTGVARLGNGKVLFTGKGVDVAVAEPDNFEDVRDVYPEFVIQGSAKSYVERACLPEAFVRAQQPDAPVADCSVPTGPRLFTETFDDEEIADWQALEGAAMWTIEPGSSGPALSLGPTGTLQRDLGAGRPTLVSFRVRIVEAALHGYSPTISLRTQDSERALVVDAGDIVEQGPGWVEVQVRDIDWMAGTFDIYTVVAGQCRRVVDDRVFEPSAGNVTLRVYEAEDGTAMLDDIVIESSTLDLGHRRSARPALYGWLLHWTLVACLPGALVRAEDTAPAAEHDAAAAEYTTEIEAALEEYQAGHFEEARGLFQHAHKLAPSARTLRGLGMVEFELRHYVRASELLEAALVDTRKPLTDDQRVEVDKLLRRTRTFVARYTIDIEPPSAEVTLELDGAQVELDARHELTVSIGEHTLTVRAPGYSTLERHLDATGGEHVELSLALSARTNATPSSTSGPGLSRVTHPHRTLGIVLASIGGLAIGTGTALGIVALSRANDAPTQDGREGERAKQLAHGTDAAFALGAISAATGLVLLLWRKHERTTSAHALTVESLCPQLRVSF